MQKGSKSKGMNLADVAKLHGMTAQELMPQLRKGIRHEYEHTTSKQVARRTALDHLVEFPDYYDRLDKIEKMHLGGDMSKHLAPNGKPSNLNHEQWHLVRTPEFKAWFGDWENDPQNASKVVDENGEPLLVYHGTPYEFTIFKKDKPTIGAYGQGYYFTNDKSFASNYARSEGSKILTCFLNVKNIFEINDDELPMGYERYSDMANNKGLSRDFTTKLKSLSYDGIIAKNRYNENEFIVFESNQIKLADGRNTTFDSENADIRFHLGGDMSKHLAPNGKPSNLNHEQWHLVRTPEFKAWFGDWENDPKNASKVVDENGEPLVVYHGTIVENAFNTFDYDKADLGFHFGTKEQAQNRIKSKKQLPLRKSMVNPFFLNIRILFEMTDVGEWEYPQRYIDELMSDNIIEEKIAKQKGFLRFYDRKDNTLIRDYIKSKYGNSVGFVYNNKYEGEGKSFIALSNNQIKLADGSNTTFYSENPDIRFHLGGDMSKHLAPNGKPSNLNHEQWHLVRTPEFKAWFGDWENDPQNASKVVDDNGEPLVVYHGSIKGINVFKTSIGKNYFSPLKYIAEDFAKYKYGDNSKVYEVFLNVKKPKYFEEIDSELLELEENKSNDGIIAKYVYVDGFNEGKQYITFNSNQIKLADGSNTTFNSENPDIRFHLGGDMSKHLAPNGKPSNLNHEQWHLVRTPEFKAWFGDWENDPQNASKVVDENGEPLVVYHGTISNFNVFNKENIGKNDYGYFGKGFYFGDLNAAEAYSQTSIWNQIHNTVNPNGRVLKCFLSMKNPLVENSESLMQSKESSYNFTQDVIKKYDGIISIPYQRFSPNTEYVAFESNQIKLADGSNTTFDGSNPDIRFKRGGRTIAQTPAPISERIYGSKKNVKGSAASKVNRITFTTQLTKSIKNKVDEHNEEYPDNKVTLATAKAVVRRGMGAYSKSHRPTISGGMPNSRQAWGLARLNKFLMKKSGKPVKKAYIQDDDLL